jgi:transposase
MNHVAIAEKSEVSEKCVRTILQNFEETDTVSEMSRSGRPRKTSRKQDQRLIQLSRTNPTASFSALTSLWLDGRQKPSASMPTISRRLLSSELRSYSSTEKPLLKPEHIQAKLNWCRDHKNWTHETWSRVIFSDESNFQLINRKNKPLVRRLKYEKFTPQMLRPKVQVSWHLGCISESGAGCCTIYTGRMDKLNYIETLDDALLPSFDMIGIQSLR